MGAFATSYIPTTSASVARAADNASMTGTNFSSWYNASAGTFVSSGVTPVAASARLLTVSNGTTSEMNTLDKTVSGMSWTIRAGGVQTANPSSAVNSWLQNTVGKVAGAYAANFAAISVNGQTAVTASPASVSTSLTQLELGAQLGTAIWNGWIKQVTYYPRAFSNTELQAITS